MRKILIAECKQEVSTFNPVLSHYEDFVISRGDAILDYHRGKRSEIGGALSAFDAQGDIELIPVYAVRAITSAGLLAGPDFQRIARELLAAVKAAPRVDGVYFSLHGAMAAEGEDDPEGYLLSEARKILGEDLPIVVSLDLHGVLTDRMLEHSNAITMFHTYPHVDFWETGERAGRLLCRIMSGEVQPVTAKVAIPALVRGDELITATGLFGESIRACQAIEQTPPGLVAGMFIGNPFTDVAELQSYSVVVTDNDPAGAERAAVRLAQDFWRHRERLQVPLDSLARSVELAAQTTSGTVMMVDAADATSSGASGDSNAILAALVKSGYRGRALVPIVDPAAVQAAFAAGIGGAVRTTVGGALDTGRFRPLPIEGRVQLLSDGHFRSESFGDSWFAGETAVIIANNYTLVVTSRAVSLYDRALFYAHGCDPKRFDLVVVKSPQCERHMFKEWCSQVVNVDAPGSTSANLPYLGHTKCIRPMFPLDPSVPFEPKARLFSRKTVRTSP
jgi:microcystin degradation protein MlrC